MGTEKDLIGTKKYKALQKETITRVVLTATTAPKAPWLVKDITESMKN